MKSDDLKKIIEKDGAGKSKE